ncbi:MAG: SGNH/GDSL hydrolase family protein [Solirubrobacterales bacterium]
MSRPGFRLPASVLAFTLASCLVIACGSSSESPDSPGAAEATGQLQTTPGSDQPTDAWMEAPVLPVFDGVARKELKQQVAVANQAGLRARVFAKVGDSNSEWAQNLYGLGCRPVDFGEQPGLAAIQRRYTAVLLDGLQTFPDCEPANSFSRWSAATVSGVWAEWLITPVEELNGSGSIPASDECEPAQTPLSCELDLLRPRFATITIGTNDALIGLPLGDEYKGHLENVVKGVRQEGSVPVLSTLPPMPIPTANGEFGDDRIDEANGIIWQVSREMKVPLVNLWRAMVEPGMENEGLAPDDLHLGVFGGDTSPDILANSAVLTPEALAYGANRRQLIWLQLLARLDSVAGTVRFERAPGQPGSSSAAARQQPAGAS